MRYRGGQLTIVSVAAATLAFGIAAESVAYDLAAVRSWATDLAVGWGLVVLGLAALRAPPRSRCGGLLCAAGFAWFLGNFAGAGVPALSWLGLHGAYLHRALLLDAVVAFRPGRLSSLLRSGLVVAAYVVALWPGLATSDSASAALGVAILAAATFGRWETAPATVTLAVAVGGVAADRLFLAPADESTLLSVYQAALLATAGLLVFAVVRASAVAVADRVVELGQTTTLAEALRRVLADPSLELGFLREGGYVDERGRPLRPFSPERRVTELGQGEAVLIHNPAVAFERGLAEAVSRALRLTTEHARLEAAIYEQLEELRASRRRLVLARGRQRALMARRLREGAERRLVGIEASLARVETTNPRLVEAIVRARRMAGEGRGSVAALALGLQPPILASEGLAGALRALVASSPVRVSLTVDERRLEAAVEYAVYLVCSEALANVAKHAEATEADVRLGAGDGWLRLEIADNGRGGANPGGRGLGGLAERVEELGGTLRVESRPEHGTRLRVEIPVRTDLSVVESGVAR